MLTPGNPSSGGNANIRSASRCTATLAAQETITHEAACTCPLGCGGAVFSRIGQDEREVLEYVPSSFKVIRHIRPKLSCRCLRDDRAAADAQSADRGTRPARPPACSHRFWWRSSATIHPLHRQAGIYAREGASNSTARPWPTGLADRYSLLDPLAEAIGRHVRAGQVLHADDTTVPDTGARCKWKTRTGRLWVVVRDERPFGSDIPPAAYYSYSPDRKGIHAQALLKAAAAACLHADGYAGFDSLYRPTTPDGAPPLIEVAWLRVYACRKFYDIHHASASPIAPRGSNGAHRRPVWSSRPAFADRRLIDAWPRASNTPGHAIGRVEAIPPGLPETDQR